LPALAYRGLGVSAAETDNERSPEERVPALLEKRPAGCTLVMVEALLVSEGRRQLTCGVQVLVRH
jgi:hypothetical protein